MTTTLVVEVLFWFLLYGVKASQVYFVGDFPNYSKP